LALETDDCKNALSEAELKAKLIDLAKTNGDKINLPAIQRQAKEILAAREVHATLAALRLAGAEAEYLVGDVQDAQQLQTVIAQIHAKWGAISGIIHGAGVLADKLISDKTPEQFAMVFDTKVKGLQALLAATADEPLTMIALFSSVAGRFGNKGQCDYAMANEILNKVAAAEQQRRGAACLVKALNWGPWESGMVSAALKAHFAQKNIHVLPVATGAQLFVQEVTHRAPGQVEVTLGSTFPTPPILPLLQVAPATHSYLLDHSIQAAPVIPICMVIDWFMRTARARYPQHTITVCENIKTLKGIRLDNFDGGHSFTINCAEALDAPHPQLQLSLLAADSTLHYSATIPLDAKPPLFQPWPLQAGTAWPWTAAEVYRQKIIFHGPAFQALQSLADLSAAGGAGIVEGVRAMSQINSAWLNEPWLLDVAALDGGLQIGWLWGCTTIGAILPMKIQRLVLYQAGLVAAPVQVVVRLQTKSAFRCVFDVQYCLADGTPIAAIEGLEMIRVP
jgi:NAD(P)-dependent dehydrogenase (short-subunit alcohol dehydrogenase family)